MKDTRSFVVVHLRLLILRPYYFFIVKSLEMKDGVLFCGDLWGRVSVNSELKSDHF